MKSFLITLSILINAVTFSMCSWSGIRVFPKTNTIEPSAWITIEGYASSQVIIDSLNRTYPIYLEADDQKIPLRLVQLNKGGFRLTQAILTPIKPLTIGQTYQLKIDHTDPKHRESLTRYNRASDKYEPITWTITPKTDHAPPTFTETPTLIDQNMTFYGCGPAIYAIFKIRAKADSQLLVKTELVDLTFHNSTTYVLPANQADSLHIGHGMCSGAFQFREGHQYKIRFLLFDLNGRSNYKWSRWILFDSPYKRFGSN